MKLKRLLGIAAIAMVAFFIISNPSHAADTVGGILAWLRNGAESVITFVSNIFH